jgi:hypothetical protein
MEHYRLLQKPPNGIEPKGTDSHAAGALAKRALVKNRDDKNRIVFQTKRYISI